MRISLFGMVSLLSCLSISIATAEDYLPISSGQTIYKWIDGKGTTHYSATPPQPNEVARNLRKIQSTPSAPKTPAPTSTDTAATAKTPDTSSDIPTPINKQTNKNRPDLNAERDQSCQTAKQNLKALTEKQRLYQKDEKGERHFLTDKEREEQKKSTQQFLDKNC